ncbi:MAG: hypothetical protein DBX55_09275 [Verrucomicrobia bacterium]|nr:MAG: hypothetical protein DBX55_09275 [Verrucomicrobiota bacterium]
MAKKNRKKVEKLAEMVGRRRPVVGSILIFAGALLALSMLAYSPGQEVFFKDYFESLHSSTESAGRNVCGRFGATATLLGLVSIGCGALMIPVYMIWVGLLCWRRSAVVVGKLGIAAIFGGLVLLSMLAAVLQAFVQPAGTPTPFFPTGAGGSLGTFAYDAFLFPVFDNAGSLLLVGTLYFACLVTVFVESPFEAVAELWRLFCKLPGLLWRAIVLLSKAAVFPARFCLNKIVERRIRKIYNPDTIENEILGRPIGKVSEKLPAAEGEEISQTSPVTEAGGKVSAQSNFAESPGGESAAEDSEEARSQFAAERGPASGMSDSDFTIDLRDVEVTPSPHSFDFSEDDEDAAPPPIPAALSRFDGDDEIPDWESSSDGAGAKGGGTGENSPSSGARRGGRGGGSESPASQGADTEADGGELGGSGFRVVHTKTEKYSAAKQPSAKGDYIFPTLDLLLEAKPVDPDKRDDYEARMREIVNVIGQFGARVLPDKASPGPVVTRYEVRPAPGVRINRIAVLEDDIALGIRAEKVRVIAPIPGKGTVGIEVPNRVKEIVCMRDLIASREWNESSAEIPIALGKDVTGRPLVVDLARMPHLLIAGTTGSGKSVCVNSIVVSLLYKMTPADLRFIMVDPKVVELQGYNALPHMLIPVVTDIKKVPAALRWLVSEMEHRYKIFKCTEVRNIAGFNAKIMKDRQAQAQADEMEASLTPEERVAAAVENESIGDGAEVEIPKQKLPYIVCIVDEFADLMMTSGKEVEQAIARLTQLARAAGIHLIIATQRPSTNVITGLIKANLSTRIALRVQSQIDSRTILDHKGAETLIGHGDMLYYPGGDFIRAQGAFLRDEEIEAIVDAIRQNGEPEYVEEIQSQIDADAAGEEDGGDDDDESSDPKMGEAIRLIRATKRVSTSFLQMKLGIGYGRAARIIDALETQGKIGPDKGPGKPRDIFLD